MADHSVNGLRAAIKALKETVAPAIDAGNPLANEQLRMVTGFLAMLAEQLPHRHQRIRYELQSALDLADAILARLGGPLAESLRAVDAARAVARRVRASDDASEIEIERATDRLNATLSAAVRSANDCDIETRRRIERTVVRHSKAWLDLQRAWFLPLGFDSDPGSVPSIVSALSPQANDH